MQYVECDRFISIWDCNLGLKVGVFCGLLVNQKQIKEHCKCLDLYRFVAPYELFTQGTLTASAQNYRTW